MYTFILFALGLLFSLVQAGLHDTQSSGQVGDTASHENYASRDYFYLGGQYIEDGAGGHLFTDQMYVEQIVPQQASKHKLPIVFIHGQAQTGTNWLNTPDGREGWASWYSRQGHTVYIVDQPQRGRSPYRPENGSLAVYTTETISRLFTAIERFNAWPQAHLHTQWPGTGFMGDPMYDRFYASQVQFQNDTVMVQTNFQRAGAALLDIVGPSIVIAHSQAGPLGFLLADVRPDLIKALVTVEPQGPPFEDRVISNSTATTRPYGLVNIPISYDPPVKDPTTDLVKKTYQPTARGLTDCILQAAPVRRLPNLSKVPMLVVTSEAGFHAGYDYCTVQYLQQGGVNAQYMNLSALGIHGNSHFMFLEKNNLDIAGRINDWILKALPTKDVPRIHTLTETTTTCPP